MKNMRTVFVHIYSHRTLGIYIASDIIPLIYYKTCSALLISLMRKYSAEKSGGIS